MAVVPVTSSALVSDAESMYTTIKRLHLINDGVLFWNEQRSFKLLLRNDPVDAQTVSCELAIMHDDEDDEIEKILELLTSDGYTEEPGVFVLESWTFQMDSFDVEDARKVMNAVNDAYQYRICPCRKYIIKDEPLICVFCQMTRTAEDKQTHFCAICREDGMRMHMTCQACCKQHLHKHCLSTWQDESGDERCPLCRQ